MYDAIWASISVAARARRVGMRTRVTYPLGRLIVGDNSVRVASVAGTYVFARDEPSLSITFTDRTAGNVGTLPGTSPWARLHAVLAY